MVTDLIGGQVEMGVVALPAVQAHLKSGALRAIGLCGKTRISALPDLSTIAEQGLPNYDIEGWFAVLAPAKLPELQVKRIHEAFVAAFNTPEVKEAMAKQRQRHQPHHARGSSQVFAQRDGAVRTAGEEGGHRSGLVAG